MPYIFKRSVTMRKILAIICQILLLQKCQGIIPSDEAGAQVIDAQKAASPVCQPLYDNLKKYMCSGHSGEVNLKEFELPEDIESLTISDGRELILNLATLTSFHKLTNLIIQDSQVKELKINGSDPVQIKVLKFIRSWSHCPDKISLYAVDCGIRLLDINSKVIYSLQGLEELHITNCTLSSITQPELPIRLTITGGGIDCLFPDHAILPQEERLVNFQWIGEWIKHHNATLADDVMCFCNVMHYKPFYSLNHISIKKKIKVDLERMEHCPSKCKCPLQGLTINKADDQFNIGKESLTNTNEWSPMIEVICKNVSLTKMPTQIPKHTTSFQASYNNITDINEIFVNDQYLKIHKILLDHNQIKSIDGDKFYKYLLNRHLDFALDLSYNQLEELPVRQMLMAYKFKRIYPQIRVTNNPFNCRKCDFLIEFQDILTRYNKGFEQSQEVRCSKSSEDYPNKRQVLSLDVNYLCAPDEPYLDQIDYINISLASILLLLFVNFAYNFYQYKTYSKLPWIVTKGPLGMGQGF
ncbi:unnamed protein product [Meganyctiphanes norvegica]|uniref:Uncharacterized protein n=1 Tax=Meganyctiphanes norvegica TaxID=48144 RepID=A0AAV2RW96_MEGNR